MDPRCVFNFFTFFERIFYKSNCIILIFSWCATHTKIRSKSVVIVTAGSQKITLWGPQRTPLGILRVKMLNREKRHVSVTSRLASNIIYSLDMCQWLRLHIPMKMGLTCHETRVTSYQWTLHNMYLKECITKRYSIIYLMEDASATVYNVIK